MKSAPLLKTERMILRGIEEGDADYIVTLRSNPDVYKYFCYPHKITKEEHIEWFRNQYIWDERRFDWMAIEKTGMKPVGVFGIKRDCKNHTSAEISYLLAPKYGGKGYACEAVRGVMGFVAEKWPCTSCIAEIHVDNHASIRFAEKLGFTLWGIHGLFAQYGRAL